MTVRGGREDLRLIYHITDYRNLDAILTAGALICRNTVTSGYIDASDAGVQGKRARFQVKIPPYGTLHDYVPFYLGPRSPMLLMIQTGYHETYKEPQRNMVYLISSVDKVQASGYDYVFTDGQANKKYTRYFNHPADLAGLPWRDIYAVTWNDTLAHPDRQRHKQAEFLVKGSFKVKDLRGFAVMDTAMKESVETILSRHDPTYPRYVNVRRDWYYP